MVAEGQLSGPAFCDAAGAYLRLPNFRWDSFLPILKRAGLPHTRLYVIRHTCVGLHFLAVVPAKVVSDPLGHFCITLNVGHLLARSTNDAAECGGSYGQDLAKPSRLAVQ
jgi:hypothetical protein